MGYYVYDRQDMHKAKAVTTRPEDSAGLAASCPAPKLFQFVTANPSSEAERSQNKILVRSNASNFHWRRVKKSSSETPANRGVPRRRSTNQRQTRSSQRVLAPLTPRNYESSSTESKRSTPKNEEDRHEHDTGSSPADSRVIILPCNHLLSLVVSGHHDPFETYPCELPREFVSPILNQSE